MEKIFAVLLTVSVVFGQGQPTPSPAPSKKPDFSGTWLFRNAADATDGQGGRNGAWSLGMEFKVMQDDKTMTVVGDPSHPAPRKSTFFLNGTTTEDSERQEAAKISWDGSKLVLTIASRPATRQQVWELDATGSLLTIETIRLVPAPTTGAVKVVYNKK